MLTKKTDKEKKAEETQPFSTLFRKKDRKKEGFYFILALLLLIVLIIASLFTGAYDLFQEDGAWMFLVTRLPRTLALILSGAGMAITGMIMQMVTQNRFVEATTTGTVEWAGLGLILVYIFFPSPSILQRMTGAVIFSFIGMTIFFLFLKRVALTSSLIVPIVGIVMGAVVSGITQFIALSFDLSQVLEVWFTGSFAQIQVGRYEYLWLVALSSLAVYFLADYMTVAGLGEDVATNLGLNYQLLIGIVTLLVAVNVGVISTVVGKLPFIGLIVPNMVRMVKGDDVRESLPWVAVLGMIVLLACDLLGRIIIAPFEMPVSLILGILGAVAFILTIYIQRRGAKQA